MSNRKIDRVSRRKGRISWWLTSLVALPLIVLTMGLSAATAYALLQEGPSAGTGPAEASVAPPVDSLPVVALGVSPTATVGAPTATDVPPTDVPPTATPIPEALIFVGDIAVGEPTCGGGEVIITVTPDGTGISSLEVRNTNIVIPIEAQTFTFDPPIPIDPDTGAFTNTGEVQPGVDATTAGTFDFAATPPTVEGSLTVFLSGTDPDDPATPPLCVVTFTAEQLEVGEEPPTPAPTAVATSAPSLPATGSSGGSDSTGALWAFVAGTVGLFALGTAGVASLRRRRA